MGFLNNDNWPISVLFCRSFFWSSPFSQLFYSWLWGIIGILSKYFGYFDRKGVLSSQNRNNIHSLKDFFRSFIERRHLFGIWWIEISGNNIFDYFFIRIRSGVLVYFYILSRFKQNHKWNRFIGFVSRTHVWKKYSIT